MNAIGYFAIALLNSPGEKMKKLTFVLLTLSSATMLSAAQQNNNMQNQKYENTNFKPTPRTVMDDEIAKNVHGVLQSTWISSGYPEVTFDVNNGTVNLRGIVETAKDKAKIEHEVKNLEGVKAVNNGISTGLNQPSSKSLTALNNATKTSTMTASTSKDSATTDKDRHVNEKIREKVSKWSPRGYETIAIATSNGVVTITGYVEQVQDIQKISNDIRSVEGVKGINNKISVKKQ